MRIANEDLTKVTLNLYTRDVDWFKGRFPQGYTERIREVVRKYIRAQEKSDADE